MMSEEPEFRNKWNASCVRTNVKDDRRDILTKARELCGYFIPIKRKDDDDIDVDDFDDDSDQDDDIKDPEYYNNVYLNQQKEFECFDVKLSRHLWETITKVNPISKNDNNYLGLQPKIWTDTLALEFWKRYRLKCAFVFKKVTIHSYGKYYATMIGRCKSKKCLNYLFCYIENDPSIDGDIMIKMNCRDTRFEKHDDCKRPLQRKRRVEMRKEVKNKGVKASNNDAARNLLEPGDTQCPIMSKPNVLYQLKKEGIENGYDVRPEDRRDLIKAVMCLNKTSIYRDSIVVVGGKLFWVFYGTPSQVHCYREYRRLHRGVSSICIDATGGVVLKFLDDCNEYTSAIFLNEIVINFYNSTISVFQMLSEAHDTDIITFW